MRATERGKKGLEYPNELPLVNEIGYVAYFINMNISHLLIGSL